MRNFGCCCCCFRCFCYWFSVTWKIWKRYSKAFYFCFLRCYLLPEVSSWITFRFCLYSDFNLPNKKRKNVSKKKYERKKQLVQFECIDFLLLFEEKNFNSFVVLLDLRDWSIACYQYSHGSIQNNQIFSTATH